MGSQGMGVISNNWFDSVLPSIHDVQTLMLTDIRTPFLGTPFFPLKSVTPQLAKPPFGSLLIFINCTIENPSFYNQTNCYLDTAVSNFGSHSLPSARSERISLCLIYL